jgi:DNA-binding transcriptional LysR family regulator
MEIKSKSIKLFCAVVETGSLLAAANKIALSTSAASRVISQLEDRLGFALFDRSGKQLTLTHEGTEFYRVAMESMRVWKKLEDFPKHKRSSKKLLRVAVLARHCSDVILPAVVTILKRNADHLRVTMDVHESRDIYYSKHSHPFDVGFGTLLSEHDDMKKIVLANLPYRLVVHRTNPLSERNSVALGDYADEDFILLSHEMLEHEHCARLHPPLKPEQIMAEVSSTQVALRMVNRNVGVHITDSLAAISVSQNCAAIALEDPLSIPFYVFWPVSSESLWPEIQDCVAEIARSILNVGIELTPEGRSFLEDAQSPAHLS